MEELLLQKIQALPEQSGVYIMKNASGQVIYVGKAKNLKKRAGQYFLHLQHAPKVKLMVENIANMEYYVTLTELDALALENTLIKKHKPFYNILLKDDKSFSYIKVNLKEDFPKFEITRKLKRDGKKYFGPYFSGVSAFEILKTLNLAFPLYTHGIKISKNKKLKQEGSDYAFTFNAFSRTEQLTKEKYREIVDKTIDFLSGNHKDVEEILTKKMHANARMQNFEQALLLRDRLKSIERMREKTIADLPRDFLIDAFGVAFDGINASVSVVVCRHGRIIGVQNYSVLSISENVGEILGEFLNQYYENKLIPEQIAIPEEFSFKEELENDLTNKKGAKVQIIVPKISVKSKFVEMATENASLHLKNSITRQAQKENSTIGALKRLKEVLSLKNFPKRIECFDISNLGGQNKVASMVVFTNGEKDAKAYRKFKINTVEGVDDYQSMREALARRMEKLDDEVFGQKPDLIIVDGGKGQLSTAQEVFEKYNLVGKIDLISLAEKFEEVYKPKNSFPFMLNRRGQEFKLIVKIRDEAHRFAVTFHRTLRGKQAFKSVLDDLKGLGENKRKLLFKKFLSIEKIKAASKQELMEIEGIGDKLAEKIIDFLKDK
jgi:excinuclease ABC subunit C